jgi:hypothetical protein
VANGHLSVVMIVRSGTRIAPTSMFAMPFPDKTLKPQHPLIPERVSQALTNLSPG